MGSSKSFGKKKLKFLADASSFSSTSFVFRALWHAAFSSAVGCFYSAFFSPMSTRNVTITSEV